MLIRPLASLFVLGVFVLLGASFIGHTGLLAYEYWHARWFNIALISSAVFVFFPTFGIVALVAFYLPASALVDMYWFGTRLGRIRFSIGFILIASVSVWIGHLFADSNRAIYMIKADLLVADSEDPKGCVANASHCNRLPILDIVANVNTISKSRLGLQDFIHPCSGDPFIEPPPTERKRFCFASTPLTTSQKSKPLLSTATDCCRSQEILRDAIADNYSRPAERSLSGRFYQTFMTLKVFFLLVALAINFLLVARHGGLERRFGSIIERIEIGLIVATLSMLIFPLMHQGDLQTLDALYGTAARSVVRTLGPYLSLLFGLGTLLVVIFFYRRRDKQIEQLGKIAGVAASAVAVVKYDLVIAVLMRVVGSGASEISLASALALAVALVVALLVASTLIQRHKTST